MKKLFTAACICLLVLCSLRPARAAERKLTLMIYMCGSNLESSYGSASADIQEMLSAAPGLNDATVLIMTGGSTSWHLGYDPGQTQICELGKRGMRVVWHSDAMNMGEPETLSQLLRFGQEKYPAQDYALIMWNHGGGPMEGVCWDELFSMDNLSLSEMTGAISSAALPQKLSWIGFDACLMSSLEVASALSPYAEYMIASQETEPAYGWNYAFLSGIADDPSGQETGRRIVDSYFEGHEDTQDVLTLSCLDLSRAEAAAQALDAFFAPAGSMNHALYTAVSGVRMQSAGFGKGIRGFNDDGYDLVDLTDLTNRLSPLLADAGPVSSALKELVCYSRANIEDANGISVYHPYMNKSKYLSHWQSYYDDLTFSAQYASYIRQFGEWLTSEALADWSGLTPFSIGFNTQGKEQLCLQLSPEQAAEFASAQLIILKKSSFNENTYSRIGTIPAQVDANGCVSAAADWLSLYAVDYSTGEMNGPLSYSLTADAQNIVREIRLTNEGSTFLTDTLSVLYYFEADSDIGTASVGQIRVYDKATGTYTNRISVDESAFSTLLLLDDLMFLPDSDGNEPLPDFYSWQPNTTAVSAFYFDPSEGWDFIWVDEILTDDNLVALFEITDTQQYSYCSQPIGLQIPDRVPFTVSSGSIDTNGFTAELTGHVNISEEFPCLRFDIAITNQTDQAAKFGMDDLTVNGVRFVKATSAQYANLQITVEPHSTSTLSASLSGLNLLYLSDITSVKFDVRHYPDASVYQSSVVPLTFQLEDCSVDAIVPEVPVLAEAEADGVRWQLLDIAPNDASGFDMLLYAENLTTESVSMSGDILINGIGSGSSLGFYTFPAGTSVIENTSVNNDAFVDITDGFDVTGLSSSLWGYMMSRHVLQGYGEQTINDITILLDISEYDQRIGYSVTLPLKQPFPIETIDEPDAIEFFPINRLPESEMLSLEQLRLLLDLPECSIRLERILVGAKNIALCLHMTNKTDQVQHISLEDVVISGAAYGEYDSPTNAFLLPPDSTSVACAVLGANSFDERALTDTFDSLSMTICPNFTGDRYVLQASVNSPVPFAHAGGVFLTPADLTFSKLQTIAAPPPVPVWDGPAALLMESVHLPDDPQQYGRTFRVQLSAEQQEQLSGALVLLVQEADNGCLNLLNYHQAYLQEDGSLTADVTGMVLCLENKPDVLVHTYQSALGDGTIELYNVMPMLATGIKDDSFLTILLNDFRIVVDPASSTAAVTSVQLDAPLPEKQQYLSDLMIFTYELQCGLQDDDLPYAAQIPINNSDSWYFGAPLAFINASPAQLAMRPVTEEDSFYIMFSVKNKDGTGYTLPAIPFFPAEDE